MDTRKKILAFGIDADGVVFNQDFHQAISKLPNTLSLAQKQKMTLDQNIAIATNEKLLTWIIESIQEQSPDAVYFISFSNRQDIGLDFGNREIKKNSLFMPILDQLVCEISKRIQKADEGKAKTPSIKLIKNVLADLYPDSKIKLKPDKQEELKALALQGWNIKNKSNSFDSGKLNIFIFIMNLIYSNVASDFLGEAFEIHYHFIDDVISIIQPLYQVVQANPEYVCQNTGASFFLFEKDQTIKNMGQVLGQGQFDMNYETHLTELGTLAFSFVNDTQIDGVEPLDKNLATAMTDGSSRYQLAHYLEYIKKDNLAQKEKCSLLTRTIFDNLEKSSNRLEYIKLLVQEDQAIFKKQIEETGDTLLIAFMKKGWFREAEYLIQLGADISIQNKFGLCAKDFLPKPSLYQALACPLENKEAKVSEKAEEKSVQLDFEITVDEIQISESSGKSIKKLQRADALYELADFKPFFTKQFPNFSKKRSREKFEGDQDKNGKDESDKQSQEQENQPKSKKAKTGNANVQATKSFFSLSASSSSSNLGIQAQSEKTEKNLRFTNSPDAE